MTLVSPAFSPDLCLLPMNQSTSQALFARAQLRIPGGVNSPVRAFKGVGGTPLFIQRAEGPYVIDEDGNRFIDYVGSWGPMILGHARAEVLEAIQRAAANGTSFGAPTRAEVEFAELIGELMPSLEMVRLVNSGTEATLSAIRLARGYTGRARILKFSGCYHGHGDSLLVAAGSGVATLGIPGTPGVTAETARDTMTSRFNDLPALEAIFAEHGAELAAVIIEPVAGNMGCVLPKPGFLERLRALCTEHGALLILDEVMTGFRVALGGAQSLYGIEPDLTTLGKIIGGGLPVGAYGGKREIMAHVAPSGPVYQAGTLSGNPLAVAAGMTQLKILRDNPDIYATMNARGARLKEGFIAAGQAAGVPLVGASVGGMFGVFFSPTPVDSFEAAQASDVEAYGRFFHALLARGVYLAPSAFETSFLSTAHSDEVVEETLSAVGEALREVSENRR